MLPLSPETEALIRARAVTAGLTPDQLICHALAAPSAVKPGNRVDREGLARLIAEVGAKPLVDASSQKEITDEGWGL